MNIKRFYARLGIDRMLLYIILAVVGLLFVAIGGTLALVPQAPEPGQIPIQTPVPTQTQTTVQEQQLLMEIEMLKLKVQMAEGFYDSAVRQLRADQNAYALNPSAANYGVCQLSYNAMVEAQNRLTVAQQELYNAQRRLAIVRQK